MKGLPPFRSNALTGALIPAKAGTQDGVLTALHAFPSVELGSGSQPGMTVSACKLLFPRFRISDRNVDRSAQYFKAPRLWRCHCHSVHSVPHIIALWRFRIERRITSAFNAISVGLVPAESRLLSYTLPEQLQSPKSAFVRSSAVSRTNRGRTHYSPSRISAPIFFEPAASSESSSRISEATNTRTFLT